MDSLCLLYAGRQVPGFPIYGYAIVNRLSMLGDTIQEGVIVGKKAGQSQNLSVVPHVDLENRTRKALPSHFRSKSTETLYGHMFRYRISGEPALIEPTL
jgi:hypothetical protein